MSVSAYVDEDRNLYVANDGIIERSLEMETDQSDQTVLMVQRLQIEDVTQAPTDLGADIREPKPITLSNGEQVTSEHKIDGKGHIRDPKDPKRIIASRIGKLLLPVVDGKVAVPRQKVQLTRIEVNGAEAVQKPEELGAREFLTVTDDGAEFSHYEVTENNGYWKVGDIIDNPEAGFVTATTSSGEEFRTAAIRKGIVYHRDLGTNQYRIFLPGLRSINTINEIIYSS